MSDTEVGNGFTEQITKARESIRNRFHCSHEALRVREETLLSHIDQIESEYIAKTQEMEELVDAIDKTKSFSSTTLTAKKLKITRDGVLKLFDARISDIQKEMDKEIYFEWDNLIENDIEQLGSIKVNDQIDILPTRTFPPQVKPVVPDYKTKLLPTAYSCKKSSDQKAPGELNNPRSITVHYETGNIYIADQNNHRVQVFNSNGDYLFMFTEIMNSPRGICIARERVFVTQSSGHCVTMYKLDGKLVKSVGIQGCGEAQFNSPHGVDVSERTNNIYVCDCNNNRVQVFTENIKFHSMLGIGVFKYPRDIKITRDRILVLDQSDPCLFVFSSDHILTNQLITRGNGKQINNPNCFDIDKEYNIVMTDYNSHSVCIFNAEGELMHKFGKNGQRIGEFIYPWGIALDNSGRIIVVCQKDAGRLQIF